MRPTYAPNWGARFDDPTLLYGKPLILFGRLAWAYDFVSNPALNAAFEALPGSSFTVNGAPLPQDSAITSAGAQYFFTRDLSFTAKFAGEFAPASQTYAGSGTLRYPNAPVSASASETAWSCRAANGRKSP
jgi:uncharacterized protein with beta-barrel porin domain